MKAIYHAANPIDAQLVMDLLAESGIGAHLQGGFLVGGIGELPAGEMLRVWVADEEANRAAQIIRETAGTFDADDWTPEASPTLARSWQRAWSSLGAQGGGIALRQRLLEAWSEPQRHYHSLQHLQECVAMIEPHLSATVYPGEVEMALWFHDAVYEVRARDNEQRSAEWAARELQAAGVGAGSVERVRKLALATRHSGRPETVDERLLVDVDLSILGAAPARFDEYERQVREEYAWVPGLIFRRKRREVLAGFQARPQLFNTQFFRDALEASARQNLQRALTRLKPWYRFWR